jgi:hypothetical protein
MLGDSIIRNVGTECSDIKVECFTGVRTEHYIDLLKRET